MAFLCPVRIRRGKKKKAGSTSDLEKDVVRAPGMGRITGSASIETLVRVGIEKENGLSPDSKMVVLHDFTPCVDDELEVKRGQVVNILYRENDWVYVIAADSRQEGFIPHSYCTPYNSQLGELAMNNVKKKLPRTVNEGEIDQPTETRAGNGLRTNIKNKYIGNMLKFILKVAMKLLTVKVMERKSIILLTNKLKILLAPKLLFIALPHHSLKFIHFSRTLLEGI